MLHLFLSVIKSANSDQYKYLKIEGCDKRFLTFEGDNVVMSDQGTKFKFMDCSNGYCRIISKDGGEICYDNKKLRKCKKTERGNRGFRMLPESSTSSFRITMEGKYLQQSNRCFSVKDCNSKNIEIESCGTSSTKQLFKFVESRDGEEQTKPQEQETPDDGKITFIDFKDEDELKEKLKINKTKDHNIHIYLSSSETSSDSDHCDSHSDSDKKVNYVTKTYVLPYKLSNKYERKANPERKRPTPKEEDTCEEEERKDKMEKDRRDKEKKKIDKDRKKKKECLESDHGELHTLKAAKKSSDKDNIHGGENVIKKIEELGKEANNEIGVKLDVDFNKLCKNSKDCDAKPKITTLSDEEIKNMNQSTKKFIWCKTSQGQENQLYEPYIYNNLNKTVGKKSPITLKNPVQYVKQTTKYVPIKPKEC